MAALALVPAAHAGGPALVAGAAEESVRQTDLTKAKASMTLLRLAGFRAVRVTSTWVGGQTAPSEQELAGLRNAVSAASLSGVRVYLAITHAGVKTTPAAAASRKEFAAYTAALAKAFPSVRDVIVGQEPNSDRSWLPQFGPKGENAAAAAYLALLAETYDALKAA